MELSNVPEVLRMPIAQALIVILKAGIDPRKFEWITKPEEKIIELALKEL
jgi:HrpA-like RNA helicase